MILEGSRYARCNILVDAETKQLRTSTRRLLEIVEDEDDRYVRVDNPDRLDLVADEVYGDGRTDAAARDWHIILDINHVLDPFDIEEGTILRVPAIERVVLETG
jgi:hypothetical protein